MQLKRIKYRLLIASIILCLISFSSLESRHIVGGEMTYECLGLNGSGTAADIFLTFRMYRDNLSGGADFDNPAQLAVYTRAPNTVNWSLERRIDIRNPIVTTIELPNQGCSIISNRDEVDVQEGLYQARINDLPVGMDILVVYQRCCRTETILNLTNSGDQGAAYQLEIMSGALEACSSSPTFNLFPPVYICAGEPLNFDHSATDIDADELVYSFCPPKIAGGQIGTPDNPGDPESCNGVSPDAGNCPPPYDNAIFSAPYSAGNPLAGAPQIRIDSETGLITGTPNTLGQFVVGVCVEEFRNGELLSIIRRDFQFNVLGCEPLLNALVDAPSLKVEIMNEDIFITSCGETEVTIANESTISNFIDIYEWNFDLNNGDFLNVTQTEKEDLLVEFPDFGVFEGTLEITKIEDNCVDIANIFINIFPSTEANFDPIFDDPCFAAPIQFENQSTTLSDGIETYSWDLGDETISDEEDISHEYDLPGSRDVQLVVTDVNGCQDSISQTIDYFPVPELIVVQPNKFIGCESETFRFTNLSTPIDSTYITQWLFSDGGSSDELNPQYTFSEPGIYDVSLQIISPIGCQTERIYPNWIEILPKPTASFLCDPLVPTIIEPDVQFTNTSIDFESVRWNFDDEFITLEENPSYSFQDTGLHVITLEVFNEEGCLDTITKVIDISPLSDIHLPNAFTPNGDGKNDGFRGVGVFEGFQNFNFSIWNRWGERIFFTTDPNAAWNGRKNNVGEPSPQGVYVYTIEYIGPRGKNIELDGNVTLLR